MATTTARCASAHPSATPAERVLRRVSVDRHTGCWVFGGSIASTGYGVVNIKGTVLYNHRITYEWFHGPIPEGLHIDHLCRVRACCNPMHLEAVTPRINARRANVKDRCIRDHDLAEHGYVAPDRAARACRACRRIRDGAGA